MDLANFNRYQILIERAAETQTIDIINGEEATEIAQRLRSFLFDCKIHLIGVNDGEAVFNSEDEYLQHDNGFSEELSF